MRWPKLSASRVFAVLMAASFLGLFLPSGWLNGFRAVANSLLTPPSVGVNRILGYFSGSEVVVPAVDSAQLAELIARLEQLEQQNKFLHTNWINMVNRYAQAEHLRKSILLESYSLIPANVYGYGLPGQSVLMIDQGKTAGLAKGYWVVSVVDVRQDLSGRALLESSVLVGRVSQVQPRTAQVRLLDDPSRSPALGSIFASLYKDPPQGQMKLSAIGTYLHVEALPGGELVARNVPNKDLAADGELADVIGALVVSNATMENLPAGLSIGRVTKVKPSPENMLFSDLTIEPAGGARRLSSVMVLRPLYPGD